MKRAWRPTLNRRAVNAEPFTPSDMPVHGVENEVNRHPVSILRPRVDGIYVQSLCERGVLEPQVPPAAPIVPLLGCYSERLQMTLDLYIVGIQFRDVLNEGIVV